MGSFKKTEKQREAVKLLSGDALHNMLYGGSRSGKTAIACRSLFVRALKVPSRHLILRLHFNHVKTSIWMDTMPKVCKLSWPSLPYAKMQNKTDYFLEVPSRGGTSEIWVAGLDNKERTEKILGTEFSTIFFNECSQLDYNSIQIAISRLAEKNSLKKKCYYDMNPPSKRHWSYQEFILLKQYLSGMPLNADDYASMIMNPVDNLENIDESYLSILDNMTEKNKQRFKNGEFSDDNENALFKRDDIQRVWELPDLDRIVVSIDPAVTSNPNSNETGIIVAGRKGDFGYILEDCSQTRCKPSEWASVAVDAYHRWNADRIVGETNNGGDLIEAVVRQYDPNVAYSSVRATRGKIKRAEPVAALYEKRRIFHYGVFEDLENQMVDFETIEQDNAVSPDRNDALVWAVVDLFDLNTNNIEMTIL